MIDVGKVNNSGTVGKAQKSESQFSTVQRSHLSVSVIWVMNHKLMFLQPPYSSSQVHVNR